MRLLDARRVHFVGVGGAGMSAIAKVLLERGFVISGSDLKSSRAATMLEAMGATVHLGHDAVHVDGADVVVISSAIPPQNPEVVRARELGIEVVGRGEALAALLEEGDAVVVAGTHGKTTTTSMIVTILRSAGRDPSYLVGGGLNDAGTNARSGTDPLTVAESDESDGSFLLLRPTVAVVTNVESDHLDHWGDFDAIRAAFAQFVGSIKPQGAAVLPAGSDLAAAPPSGVSVTTFGDGAAVRATDVEATPRGLQFALEHEGRGVRVALRVHGANIVSNALAAAGAGLAAGLSLAEVAEGLRQFGGVERRFQSRGTVRGVTVIDDYAHHPTEVRELLKAARAGGWKRVVAVFQPHRYSRTRALHRDFGPAFSGADVVIVTDVYGAGELPVPGVSGKLVADAVAERLPGRRVAYLPHRAELMGYLTRTVRSGDAVLTLGAGDITLVGEELVGELRAAGED
ncbi:MAG: UDP-N-acetylmuramate--L-alanine ligase [Actinomycetota bacterium]